MVNRGRALYPTPRGASERQQFVRIAIACQTANPALCQTADNRPAVSRGGLLSVDIATRHFVNNKKTACVYSRNSVKYAYETAKA